MLQCTESVRFGALYPGIDLLAFPVQSTFPHQVVRRLCSVNKMRGKRGCGGGGPNVCSMRRGCEPVHSAISFTFTE